MGLIIDPYRFSAPIVISLADNTFSASAASTFSFTSRAFGAEAGDRDIVVACAWRSSGGNRTVASINVAGNAATIDTANNSLIGGTVIARYRLPTGTTGDVVVNASGGNFSHCGVAIYRMTGASTSSPLTAANATNSTSVTENVNVSAGGGAIAANYADQTSVTAIGFSAGVTENAEHELAAGFVYSAYGSATFAAAATPQAFTGTRTQSGTGTNHFSVAAYSPV